MTEIPQDKTTDQWWRQRELLVSYDRWLFKKLDRFLGQRVLEVGCGTGTMTGHLLGRELVVAVDLSSKNVARAKNRLGPHPNGDVLVMDVTRPEVLGLRPNRFDTVVCSNVLEHLVDDRLALHNMHGVLQDGGQLVLVVPAHSWLYGPLDESVGHYRRYGAEHLRRLLTETGFAVRYQAEINLVGVLGWFVVGRLLKQSTIPSFELNLFDRLVPWAMTLESLCKPPFGLSLVCVGQRIPGGESA